MTICPEEVILEDKRQKYFPKALKERRISNLLKQVFNNISPVDIVVGFMHLKTTTATALAHRSLWMYIERRGGLGFLLF